MLVNVQGDGFEAGNIACWSEVSGGPTTIGGPTTGTCLAG